MVQPKPALPLCPPHPADPDKFVLGVWAFAGTKTNEAGRLRRTPEIAAVHNFDRTPEWRSLAARLQPELGPQEARSPPDRDEAGGQRLGCLP
jgi:hypothetical protein